jgi:hypothetical protein
MSIPVLVEVYDEMRRLAIAGSAVAPGDFRLKKLIGPLEKMGEKAPVFAKVAQAAQGVVESNEKSASLALLELTTLVNAILHTQGETAIAGELQPIETTDLGACETQASARVLKPLLEALATSGSGRLELIRDSFERGTFRDLRLVRPALNALDDSYPEIGDFIADNVLPLYGSAILPQLCSQLDMKGRGGDVRRLRLIHELDPEAARPLIKQALEEGSKEMRVAAIECLGGAADDLSHLLEHAKAKAKDVRAAALRALTIVGAGAADAIAALKKAIAGADLDLIIPSVRRTPVGEVHEFVLMQVDERLAELRKTSDKAEQGKAVARLLRLLCCLTERTDAETEALLLRFFAEAPALARIKSEPSGSDLNELVANLMAHGTTKTREHLAAAHESLTGTAYVYALVAARLTQTPAKFFENFKATLKAPWYKKLKKNAADAERAKELAQVLLVSENPVYFLPGEALLNRDRKSRPQRLPELDPRWLDVAVEAEQADLVFRLARPDHAATNKFLSQQVDVINKKIERHEPGALLEKTAALETIVRVRNPGATQIILDWLREQAKTSVHGYYGAWAGRLIPHLPASALPQLEALLPSLPEKLVDQLMEPILELKNKVAEAHDGK